MVFKPQADVEPRILAALAAAPEPLTLWEICRAIGQPPISERTVGNYLRGLVARKEVRRGAGVRRLRRFVGGYGREITTNPMVYSVA